jgi:myo-inositol-1(or 4)-monophosphatase
VTARGARGGGPEDLLALAELAARQAGALIRDQRPADLQVASTKSSPTDVVTAMDTAAEALLTATLLDARPDDGLLGEESGLRSGTSGLTWVVDPIDGTVNYLYDIPAYAVSVAVVEGEPQPSSWRVVAGCVHNPRTDETWTATADGPALLNGVPVPGPREVPLAQALVGTGFGYTVGRRRKQAQVVAALLPRVRDIRRIGSSALDLCALASGRLDAYYERGLQPWDHAAAGLIASRAGARVSGLNGTAAGAELLVAARPRLAEALWAELSGLDPLTDDLV